MIRKKPVGVIIIGAIMTFLGGFSSLIIFVEVIDSLRLFGFSSIWITSLYALEGFFLYAGMPIIMYTTGIGLFMYRSWARISILYVLPVMSFFFFFNIACNMIRERSYYIENLNFDLLIANFDVLVSVFLRYMFIVIPIIIYFNLSDVKFYFRIINKPVNK